jgi:FAD:protein FMN transferase
MGSVATITLYADSPEQAQRAFVAAFARIAQLNRILSDYDPQSELSRACEIGTQPSSDLLAVLTYAQRLAGETAGAFDITVGPLTRLWRAARKTGVLPTQAQIDAALARAGFLKLGIEKGAIRCSAVGMLLDAGGLAKGYAADEAAAALRKVGVTSVLVALSGDIAIGDPPPGRDGWKVKVLDKVRLLSNCAVSTSGDEFQFAVFNGVRYSHIVDPRSGVALRESRTVAVIAPKAIDSDAIATAVSVAGRDLVDKLPSTYKAQVFIQ